MQLTRLVPALLTLLLVVSLPSTALQFGPPGSPRIGPPGATPPTFPTDSHPSSTMPPDTMAPHAIESSNSEVAGQIRTVMADERRLLHDNVNVDVTDDRVTLGGRVANNDHRYLALKIAGDHAGTRSIVDRLRMGEEQ